MGLIARLYSWSVLVVLSVLNLVYAQRVLHLGGLYVSVFALVAVCCVAAGLVLLPRFPDIGGSWRQTRWVVISFGALLAWMAISGIGRDRQIALPEIDFPMTRLAAWVAYIPMVEAVLAIGCAWLFVGVLRNEDLKPRIFQLCVVMLACGVIGQVRALYQGQTARLSTGLGGAATLPVVLILVLAACSGLALAHYQRRWSALLAVIAFVELVLTGSRSGLVMGAAFIAASLVAWWLRNEPSRRQLMAAIILVACVLLVAVVLIMTLPELARVMNLNDPARQNNFRTAWGFSSSSARTLILGAGLGVVWPWYAIDAGIIPFTDTPHGLINVPGVDGHVLSSPHSLFAAVLVEGGIIGLLLLLGMVMVLLRSAWRARRDPLAGTILIGILATLIAFTFDSYLLKNFSVSWVWWLFLLLGLRLAGVAVSGREAGSATTAPATAQRK